MGGFNSICSRTPASSAIFEDVVSLKYVLSSAFRIGQAAWLPSLGNLAAFSFAQLVTRLGTILAL